MLRALGLLLMVGCLPGVPAELVGDCENNPDCTRCVTDLHCEVVHNQCDAVALCANIDDKVKPSDTECKSSELYATPEPEECHCSAGECVPEATGTTSTTE